MFNLVISYHFSHIGHSYNLAISNHFDGFPQIILGHFVSNLSHFEQTYKRWTEERTDTRTSDVKHKHSDNTSLPSCMKNDQGAICERQSNVTLTNGDVCLSVTSLYDNVI